RRRHTRSKRDWSSDVCSSDLDEVEDRTGMIARTWKPVDLRAGRPKDEPGAFGASFAQRQDRKRPQLVGESQSNIDALSHRYGERSEERRVGKECKCGGTGGH